MFARLKLVMCLLNENKTEAYLLRVLIEVGRRAKTYPKRSVRMIPASRNAFQLVTKAIVSIKSTFWFQRHNNFNWNWCIHSEKRVILTSSKNRTDHSFDKHAAGVHFCCRFTQYQHPPNILRICHSKNTFFTITIQAFKEFGTNEYFRLQVACFFKTNELFGEFAYGP